ncbi:hypothetical protein QUF84_05605 [Fictibacillus enclensis]|uniref:hypothetical protein n=1 Tax=Fictibacillus enclensis TaxID=1017270 RepID=UPI0025A0E59B|nr:hypothetical protein [Fictibacillus enclensis]MDM5336705.1 hypothetical protein [Fictibacillus enclensis]
MRTFRKIYLFGYILIAFLGVASPHPWKGMIVGVAGYGIYWLIFGSYMKAEKARKAKAAARRSKKKRKKGRKDKSAAAATSGFWWSDTGTDSGSFGDSCSDGGSDGGGCD